MALTILICQENESAQEQISRLLQELDAVQHRRPQSSSSSPSHSTAARNGSMAPTKSKPPPPPVPPKKPIPPPKPQMDAIGYSMANVQNSAETDIDELLGELSALESQLSLDGPNSLFEGWGASSSTSTNNNNNNQKLPAAASSSNTKPPISPRSPLNNKPTMTATITNGGPKPDDQQTTPTQPQQPSSAVSLAPSPSPTPNSTSSSYEQQIIQTRTAATNSHHIQSSGNTNSHHIGLLTVDCGSSSNRMASSNNNNHSNNNRVIRMTPMNNAAAGQHQIILTPQDEQQQQPHQRPSSPDNDSAFCDSSSLMSGESTNSTSITHQHAGGVGGQPVQSSGQQTQHQNTAVGLNSTTAGGGNGGVTTSASSSGNSSMTTPSPTNPSPSPSPSSTNPSLPLPSSNNSHSVSHSAAAPGAVGGRNINNNNQTVSRNGNLAPLGSVEGDEHESSTKGVEVDEDMTPTFDSETDAKVKSDKIKLALEKMKEASIKKMYVKFFSEDGSSKSLLIDERWTVAHVQNQLAEKYQLNSKKDHYYCSGSSTASIHSTTSSSSRLAIREHHPDLLMDRVYEDHEHLVENILMWTRDSGNKLYFTLEAGDKYQMFREPQNFLVPESSQEHGKPMDIQRKRILIEEFFAPTQVVQPPEMEGFLHLKSDGKKAWKKCYFVLRASGLYFSRGKPKPSKEMERLMPLEHTQVYSGVNWRKKYKAPSEWGIALKHPQIQLKCSKYIKYLCADDSATWNRWMVSLRIAKNGRQLYENYEATEGDDLSCQSSDQQSLMDDSTTDAACSAGSVRMRASAVDQTASTTAGGGYARDSIVMRPKSAGLGDPNVEVKIRPKSADISRNGTHGGNKRNSRTLMQVELPTIPAEPEPDASSYAAAEDEMMMTSSAVELSNQPQTHHQRMLIGSLRSHQQQQSSSTSLQHPNYHSNNAVFAAAAAAVSSTTPPASACSPSASIQSTPRHSHAELVAGPQIISDSTTRTNGGGGGGFHHYGTMDHQRRRSSQNSERQFYQQQQQQNNGGTIKRQPPHQNQSSNFINPDLTMTRRKSSNHSSTTSNNNLGGYRRGSEDLENDSDEELPPPPPPDDDRTPPTAEGVGVSAYYNNSNSNGLDHYRAQSVSSSCGSIGGNNYPAPAAAPIVGGRTSRSGSENESSPRKRAPPPPRRSNETRLSRTNLAAPTGPPPTVAPKPSSAVITAKTTPKSPAPTAGDNNGGIGMEFQSELQRAMAKRLQKIDGACEIKETNNDGGSGGNQIKKVPPLPPPKPNI